MYMCIHVSMREYVCVCECVCDSVYCSESNAKMNARYADTRVQQLSVIYTGSSKPPLASPHPSTV